MILYVRDLTLKNGSEVVVIGGGPAGSFFTHFIHKYSAQKGIHPNITVYDGKDFLLKGPKGCNLCAGIISDSLSNQLRHEGISIPEDRIVNRLEGYELHAGKESLFLTCEEFKTEKIAAVYRGNGPRESQYSSIISFDDFLLSMAKDRGAQVIHQPVWDIRLPEDRKASVDVFFGDKENPHVHKADLVVGAFGVNAYFLKKMEKMGFWYRSPSTIQMYQAEIPMEKERVAFAFGNKIHVYLPKSRHIRYAVVIPKGDFISVTLVGRKDATKDLFHEFARLMEPDASFAGLTAQCFCFPRMVLRGSKNPLTNRLLMIGDAAYSRLFKNGIESAFFTAKLAAEAAVFHGLDARSLFAEYQMKAERLIVRDNLYGRLLFGASDVVTSTSLLTRAHIVLARGAGTKTSTRKIRSVIWNVLTGNLPYKDIYKTFVSPGLQLSWFWNLMRLMQKSIKSRFNSLFLKTQRRL